MKLHQAMVKNKAKLRLAFFPNPWYLPHCNNEVVEKRQETHRAAIAAGTEGQFEARLP